MGTPKTGGVQINLVRVLELLHTHITASLCQTVFATLRTTERQRHWTLEALVQFWLAVVLRAPRALSQALYETLEGHEPLFPHVQATPEAFFQRCQTLHPIFFAAVFARFTARLLGAVPPRYAPDLALLQARFAAICVLDGSRLEAISPAKFFPKMAAACQAYALFELWFAQAQRTNPGRRLRKPAVHERRFANVALHVIVVEPRKGHRRKRRFCEGRRHWKSLAHVRGGRKMLKLTGSSGNRVEICKHGTGC